MAEKKVSVVLEGKMDGLSSTLQRAESETERHTRAMTSSFDRVDGGIMAVGRSMGALAAGAGALGVGALVKDVTMAAARFETLGVVMTVVGKNSGYTATQMLNYADGVAKMGISNEASRDTVVKMASAQIDLSKAQQLARIAQDAAVIGNINSSEAFASMIYGIQSGQTDVLKTIGINVSFEDSYKKLALTLGKSTTELSELEKMTAKTNAVMERGPSIAGAYEASMDTVGKQVNSLKRYHDDLKVVVGETFTPTASMMVQDYTAALAKMYKLIKENKGGAGDDEGVLSSVYKTIRLSGNVAMAQADVVGAEYAKLQQLIAGVAKRSPLGMGKGGSDFFEEMEYQGAGKMNAFQADFWDRQDKINAFGNAKASAGPVLDPSEAARLRMMQDRNVKTPDAEKAGTSKTAAAAAKKRAAEAKREREEMRKIESEMNVDMLDGRLQLIKQATKAQEDLQKIYAEMDLDAIDGLRQSEPYLNYLGKMSDSQQAAFDKSSMLSSWAAKNSASDQAAKVQGKSFSASGGTDSDWEKQRIQEEAAGWTESWAMQTDSFEIFEQRKLAIAQRSATQMALLTQTETSKKLGYAQSGFASMASIADSFYQLSGQKSKTAFKAYQVMKSGEIGISTADAAMKAYSAMSGIPYVGPALGAAAAIAVGLAGAVQLQNLWNQSADSANTSIGGSGSASGSGGGYGSMAIPTQPQGATTQQQGNVTIQLRGIPNGRYIEEELIPGLNAAGSRNVKIEYLN